MNTEKHRRLVPLLSLLTVLMLAACGGDKSKLMLGTGCTLNSDCNDPLLCKFSKCHRACNETRDCDPGRRCVKVDGIGVCQLPEEQSCSAVTACVGTLTCASDSQCRNACPLGNECFPGEICHAAVGAAVKVCARPTETIVTGLPEPDAGVASDGGLPGADGSVPGTPDGGAGGDAPMPVADSGGTLDTPPAVNRGPLLFDISATPNPVQAKGRVFYNMTVSNISAKPVDLVKVLMRVPMGLSFGYFYDAEPNNTSCSTCANGAEAVWALGTMAPGASQSITVNAAVAETLLAGHNLATLVRLSATGVTPIDITKDVLVTGPAAAEVAVGASKDAVIAGETFTVDLDVGNVGDVALAGKSLRARLPAGLTAAVISDAGMAVSPTEIVWPLEALPVGDALRRQLKVTAAAGLPAGEVLTVRTELVTTGAPPVEASAEHTVTVAAAPLPLRVEVTTQPSPAVAKGRVLYAINVSNLAPRPLDEVWVVMRVANGQSFSYFYDVEPNNTACSACVAGSEAAWSLGTLAPGASETITINAAVVEGAEAGTLMTTHIRAGAKGVETIDLAKTTQVHNTPSVQFALAASKDAVNPSEAFSYTVDVGHIGAAALSGAALRLRLPAGVTVGAISDGGTATAPQEISWTIGDIAVSGAVHREVSLTVAPTVAAGELLAARAELTYAGGTVIDASAEHTVRVMATPHPLKLTVTAAPTPAMAGMRLLYTFTVSNASARVLDGVKLMFRVPQGMQYSYFYDADPDNTGCSACNGGAEAFWTIPTLAVGASQTITVNATVDALLASGSLLTGNLMLTATGVDHPLFLQVSVPGRR